MKSQRLQELCVNDVGLCRYVKYRARKIVRQYRPIIDIEDAENDLWVSIFSAIERRPVPPDSVIDFARNVVFSAYGHAVSRSTKPVYVEYTDSAYVDTSFEIVDARITISDIENALHARWGESRTYRLSSAQLKHLLEGRTFYEFQLEHGVSQSYGYYIQNVIRECAEAII